MKKNINTHYLKRVLYLFVLLSFYIVSAELHWLPAFLEYYTGEFTRDLFTPVVKILGIEYDKTKSISQYNTDTVSLQKKNNKNSEVFEKIFEQKIKKIGDSSDSKDFFLDVISVDLGFFVDRVFREPKFLYVSKQMEWLKEQSLMTLEKRSYLLLNLQKNHLLLAILEEQKDEDRFATIEKLEFDLFIEQTPSIRDYAVYSLSKKIILSASETKFLTDLKSTPDEIEITDDGFIIPIYNKNHKKLGYLLLTWNILLDPNVYLSRSSFTQGVDMLLILPNKKLLSPLFYLSSTAQSFIQKGIYTGNLTGTSFTKGFSDDEVKVQFMSMQFPNLEIVFLYQVVPFSFYLVNFLKFSLFMTLLLLCGFLLTYYWPLYKKILLLVSSTRISVLEESLKSSLSLQEDLSNYLLESESFVSNMQENVQKNKQKQLNIHSENTNFVESNFSTKLNDGKKDASKKSELLLKTKATSFKRLPVKNFKKNRKKKNLKLDTFSAEFKSVSLSGDSSNRFDDFKTSINTMSEQKSKNNKEDNLNS